MRTFRVVGLGFLLCVLLACDRSASAPESLTFHADENPEKLSAWGVLYRESNKLLLAPGAKSYFLASALFSDYAQKLRTVSLPPDQPAFLGEDGRIVFPVGSVISKTFYYPLAALAGEEGGAGGTLRFAKAEPAAFWDETRQFLDLDRVRLLETRLLVKRADGWHALPYVWSDNQQEAVLERTGAVFAAELATEPGGGYEKFNYIVPNQNQCAGCHTLDQSSKALLPIGLRYRHLQGEQHFFAGRQLQQWHADGLLKSLSLQADGIVTHETATYRTVPWRDAGGDLNSRARSYMDINCGHCHSRTGPADTSGLFLDAATEASAQLGICKTPIAAGQGTGGHLFSILPGKPDESILLYRMLSQDPGAMMPELGRTLVHKEAAALIAEWIERMPGKCVGSSGTDWRERGNEQRERGSEQKVL